MDEQINKILDGIKILDGEYKRELVDKAIELQDEITRTIVGRHHRFVVKKSVDCFEHPAGCDFFTCHGLKSR